MEACTVKSPVCQQQIKRETAEEAPQGDSQGTQTTYIFIYIGKTLTVLMTSKSLYDNAYMPQCNSVMRSIETFFSITHSLRVVRKPACLK